MCGYEVKPDDDMTCHGWEKAITWLDVKKINGQWTITEYDYDSSRYQCDTCNTNSWLWLVLQPIGVYLACTGCKEISGPLTKDGAMNVSSRTVTPEEALETLKKRGVRERRYEIPAELMKDIKKRRVVVSRRGKGKRPAKRG